MFCLDWQELGLEVYGSWDAGNMFQAIDIMAFPCGTRLGNNENGSNTDSQDCNWD